MEALAMRHLALLLLLATASAAEITTLAGAKLGYDTLDCDPKRPKSCFVLKQGATITTLKQSELDPAALPEAVRAQLAAYAAAQAAEGLILYDDEWIDRDGQLLKTDPRFSYPKKFHAVGRNRFILKNISDKRLTIGIRPTGEAPDKRRGYELAVPPFKEKAIQMPDGEFVMLLVNETADDAELMVSESEPVTLQNMALTVTYPVAEGEGMRMKPAGTISVPEGMRRGK
jgi:hypothetical protein